jgi:N-acetyltransferase
MCRKKFFGKIFFMKIEPVVLEGEFVRLAPMTLEHLDALCEIGLAEEIWRWSPEQIVSREAMKRYVETALDEQKRGVSLPFVTIDKAQNKIVGSTRFGNIAAKDRRVEIGWTWINPAWQRTFVNTEAKLLMLRHAFETWKVNRVELKTDALNEKSRNAILRLGAREEGVLRRHIVCQNGRLRDTVYYGIIEPEWRAVRENLEVKLKR